MATPATLDASPATVLRAFRGTISDARLAHPGVLHVEVHDAAGGEWRLATQDAEWSPGDPIELQGCSIEGAEIDEETGELRVALSGGSRLEVNPNQREATDDPPNWELITPDGLVLEFGPGMRWQVSRADIRVVSR